MNDLAGKKMVGIVPDGVLWRVPFASLVGSDGRFVAERLALFYVPSLSVYRQFKQQRATTSGPRLAAFGDPAIGTRARSAITVATRGAELVPLPNAKSEVERIARVYGPRSRVFTGSAAFEERAKANLHTARVIHFATHGLADDRNPMYSHVLLAQGPPANEDDGVLEAWELMQLDINAELVVLSACDTGRGRVGAGEGLVGLSWALFVAGCPSTVVTLWKVRSDTTADGMVSFHRHLLANERSEFATVRALASAQREMLRHSATRHPFYWAPFIVIGKP
jgi:CHAT domain-containing protein